MTQDDKPVGAQREFADGGTSPRGWYTVIILGFVSTLSFVDRGVLALFVQPIKHDFQLSDTEMSLLLGVLFTVPYFLIGFPMSRLIDRGNRRNLIAGCLALWSVATAVCGIAQNYWTLAVCRFATGGAESVNTSGSLSMIADCVSREKMPRAFAIQALGVAGGTALSLLIGGVLYGMLIGLGPFHFAGLTIHNWQLVFLIVGIPGLLLALVMVTTLPEPARRGAQRPGGYPLREVLTFVRGLGGLHGPLLGGMLLNAVMLSAYIAWTPAFFERTYGWEPQVSGPLLGASSLICSILGLTLGARLTEHFARKREDANLWVLFIGQGLAMVPLVIAPLMSNPWLALALISAAHICSLMGNPGFSAALQITTPNEMRAQVNVMYASAITAIGGSIGPTLVGALTDTFGRTEGDLRYVMTAVRLVISPVAVFLIWKSLKPYGRRHAEVTGGLRLH